MKNHAIVFLCCSLWTAPAFAAEERVLAAWTFDQPNHFQGWQANGHIANATVTNGALSGRTVGDDPILELKPLLNLTASPWQVIEVRLKADHDGPAQFFWSGTTQGKYGGFSGDKTTDFSIVGDRQWHTHRLYPFWHAEGKIVRLRFDLPGGTGFSLASIRILEMPVGPVAGADTFDFAQGAQGWQAVGAATIIALRQGIQVGANSADDFILAPPVRINAEEKSFVAVRMAATQGRKARLLFATDKTHGLQSHSFPILADGQEHLYNVDLLAASGWKGRVVALGFRPSEATNATATVRGFTVAAEPQGPPQLSAPVFALEEAAPRVGVPAKITATIANTGGGAATNWRAALSLPPGVRIVQSPAHNESAKQATPPHPALSPTGGQGVGAPLGYGEELTLTWLVEAAKPVKGTATLRLAAANAARASFSTPVEFLARPNLPKAACVPEPKPVRGPYDVGVYYFPGWKSMSQWQPIQRFPERKPVLGWYREGDPEVADWHIKWAVEHGITFFAYDWYWSQGARHLEHGLHDGYFNARYRGLLKFCLLWANHNAPKTHSVADSIAVTRYWITNYFQRPEYYRIEGKPLVVIFSPYNYKNDLGSAEVNRAFAAMREECRKAGLPGLHLAACVGGPHQVDGEDYDSVTAYNWPGLGVSGTEKQAPFATLIQSYQRQWLQFLESGRLPMLLPISGGWDSRPWHGDSALVRYGRTPALFKQHLRDARALLDQQPARTNLLKSVIIEAWNEWGEGSYIEPHKEFGFQYLEAIREVFAPDASPHADLAPVDVGLGPYDLPPQPPSATAWTFANGVAGWDNTMNLTQLQAQDGVLSAVTSGNDPAFFGPPMQARAAEFPVVALRMRLTAPAGAPFRDSAQLFWRAKRWPESEASSVHFPVAVDGQWHDYRLPVGENRRWTGVITRLRLDPGTKAGVKVEVEEIGLRKGADGNPKF